MAPQYVMSSGHAGGSGRRKSVIVVSIVFHVVRYAPGHSFCVIPQLSADICPAGDVVGDERCVQQALKFFVLTDLFLQR